MWSANNDMHEARGGHKTLVALIAMAVAMVAFPLTLSALDNAEFWNLGFSDDSRYVCFGQYWVDSRGLVAHAELNVVDVSRNSFVHNGKTRLDSSVPVSAGSTGRNSILDLVRQTHTVLERYAIRHANQGRIIYLNIDDTARDTIEFQDFQSDDRYSVQLIRRVGSGGTAFHLQGVVTRSTGRRQSFSVGLPNYYRPNVVDYSISQIILAPNKRSYVFVIEQMTRVGGGVGGDSAAPVTRYMIETISIDQ